MHRILAEVVEEVLRSQLVVDQGTFTPELTAPTTDPNLGDAGSIIGFWVRRGNLITQWVEWRYDGSGISGGSGIHEISLVWPADTSIMSSSGDIGVGSALGSGNYQGNLIVPYLMGGGATMRLSLNSGVGSGGVVSDSDPDPPGADTESALIATYIADPAGLP